MAQRANPRSFRPDEDDEAIIRELMLFWGVKTEATLTRMAYRALRREMWAVEAMRERAETNTAQRGKITGGGKQSEAKST